MSAALVVRPAVADDRAKLRQAAVELQEHERRLHATRLPAAHIADAYLDWMLARAECDGAVLVAEQGGAFAGFVAGWIEQADAVAETVDSNRFGYISDIRVMPAYRGQRIARRLLGEIEACLRRHGLARVRINALAANEPARRSYERARFVPYEILYDVCGWWAAVVTAAGHRWRRRGIRSRRNCASVLMCARQRWWKCSRGCLGSGSSARGMASVVAALAGRAAVAVAAWPQAAVIAADGSSYCGGQFDLIVASAGVTHPPPAWLDLM